MRRAIIIAACVGVLFLALLSLTGTDNGKPDSHIESPPAWIRMLGTLAAPLAPRLKLGTESVRLLPNQVTRFSIGPDDDASSRIGRFALADGSPAGAAAKIVLNRPPGGPGDWQEVCLTATDGGVAVGCDEAPRSEGSIVVGKDGGTLTIQALNNLPVTVVQR